MITLAGGKQHAMPPLQNLTSKHSHGKAIFSTLYILALIRGWCQSHTQNRGKDVIECSAWYLQKLSAECSKFLSRADKGQNGLECWYEVEPNIVIFWLWAQLSLNYVFFCKSQQRTKIIHGVIDISLFYLCGPATYW